MHIKDDALNVAEKKYNGVILIKNINHKNNFGQNYTKYVQKNISEYCSVNETKNNPLYFLK